MARLDTERQERLEPKRMADAIESVQAMGYEIITNIQIENKRYFEFEFKGSVVRYFPYTGWATGKSIKDGRGLVNLLKQIKP